jgi:hypothetical protein
VKIARLDAATNMTFSEHHLWKYIEAIMEKKGTSSLILATSRKRPTPWCPYSAELRQSKQRNTTGLHYCFRVKLLQALTHDMRNQKYKYQRIKPTSANEKH